MEPKVVTIIDISNTQFYQLCWSVKRQIMHHLAKYNKSKGRGLSCTIEEAASVFDTKGKQTLILKLIFGDDVLAFQGKFIALATPNAIKQVFLSPYLPPGKTYMIKTQKDLIDFLMNQDITDFKTDLKTYQLTHNPYAMAKEITDQVIDFVSSAEALPNTDTIGKPWYDQKYGVPPKAEPVQKKTPVQPAGPPSSQVDAGVKAAATRKQITNYMPYSNAGHKNYITLTRTAGGGLRIPKSFVSTHLHQSAGTSILVVGSKGIKPYSACVKNDGSIYINADKLSNFNRDVFQIRGELGNNGRYTLIIK